MTLSEKEERLKQLLTWDCCWPISDPLWGNPARRTASRADRVDPSTRCWACSRTQCRTCSGARWPRSQMSPSSGTRPRYGAWPWTPGSSCTCMARYCGAPSSGPTCRPIWTHRTGRPRSARTRPASISAASSSAWRRSSVILTARYWCCLLLLLPVPVPFVREQRRPVIYRTSRRDYSAAVVCNIHARTYTHSHEHTRRTIATTLHARELQDWRRRRDYNNDDDAASDVPATTTTGAAENGDKFITSIIVNREKFFFNFLFFLFYIIWSIWHVGSSTLARLPLARVMRCDSHGRRLHTMYCITLL